MGYATLNIRFTPARSAGCRKTLLQFLRENRWPIETIEVRLNQGESGCRRQWEVDGDVADIAEEIMRYISFGGYSVEAKILVRDGFLHEN
jgi:hypothetical protein